MGTGKEEKKTWKEDIRRLLLYKCNIFHPENAISGPFEALKKRDSGKNLRLPIPVGK